MILKGDKNKFEEEEKKQREKKKQLKYMFDLLNLNDANMEKIKKICEE
jgi:hypothetical protein